MALDAIEIAFFILALAVVLIALVFKTMAVAAFWMKCLTILITRQAVPFSDQSETVFGRCSANYLHR